MPPPCRSHALVGEAGEAHGCAYSAYVYLFSLRRCWKRPVAGGHALELDRVAATRARVVWVSAELAALERSWARSRFVTPSALVIALGGPLASREAAHRALDRALLAEALGRSGGRYAEPGAYSAKSGGTHATSRPNWAWRRTPAPNAAGANGTRRAP